jgi:hypothetical protein
MSFLYMSPEATTIGVNFSWLLAWGHAKERVFLVVAIDGDINETLELGGDVDKKAAMLQDCASAWAQFVKLVGHFL